MNYFKNTREFLEKYLYTNPELKKMSPNEAYDFETLCGQVKFDEVWTEKDFQVLYAEIGVKAQNAYLQDMSDIKLYFMNRVIDLAKTGLVTKTEIRKTRQPTSSANLSSTSSASTSYPSMASRSKDNRTARLPISTSVSSRPRKNLN